MPSHLLERRIRGAKRPLHPVGRTPAAEKLMLNRGRPGEAMRKTRLRGAIFGCGMISEFHLKAWERIREVEIVALGSRTLARAEARRARFAPAARVHEGLQALLEKERLDFLDILTPPALHKEHCLEALGAGLHVICQKPLCDSLPDARELVKAMEGSGKLFAVHENHRYRPWFRRVVDFHRRGFFGALRLARFEQHDPKEPAEAYKLDSQRGILLEYGTHLVDMMRALLGEPLRVTARLEHANARVKGESRAAVVYEYPEARAEIDISWQERGAARGGVRVEGARGSALYEGTMTRGQVSRFRLLQGPNAVVDEARSPLDDYCESFHLFQRQCVEAMLAGRAVEQTGAENLKTLECTFAAYAAAEAGRAVEVAGWAKADP